MKDAISAFNRYAAEYDRWFEENPGLYEEEIRALCRVVPRAGTGLEIGCGSGRFASCLGIRHGIDPAARLLKYAQLRQIEPVIGVAEALPYRDGSFDYVLLMNVICLLEELDPPFRETCRVLVPGGTLVIGFFDRNGEIARREMARDPPGRFLRHATFRTGEEVTVALAAAGFSACSCGDDLHGLCIVTAQKR